MAKMTGLSTMLMGVIALVTIPIAASGQDNGRITLQDAVNGYESVTNGYAGVPHDWSHRHLIFSPPAPNSLNYSKITRDPRFWQQQLWRLRQQSEDPANSLMANVVVSNSKNTKSKDKVSKDWSVGMGSNASVGIVAFPAKYSITPTKASCTDYVAYNTGSAGTQVSTATFSTSNNNVPNSGDTVTVGSTTYTFVTTPSSANQVQIGPDSGGDSPKESAANLQAAINANTAQCILGNQCFGTGTTANSSASATVELNVTTITAKTRGSGGNFTFSANAGTGSGARITTSSTSGGTAPSIVGFTNLYSGCGGTVPTTNWAYNTNGNITTSPVVSSDGSQIAFVQSEAGVAHLILLKWKGGAGQGSISVPVTPTSATASNYRSHAAACMLDLTFSGSPNDSHSDPFYNYSTDALYVGANDGTLHKFTGVFSGTPAEVTASWPITVHSNNALTSPVYDSVSGNLFMWDSSALLSYVREVGSSVGTCKSGTLPCLGATTVNLGVDGGSGTGQASIDSPLVDSSSQRVFAFVPCASTNGDNGCGDPDNDSPAEVVQTSTNLLTVNRQKIGGSSIFDRVYDGDFDDNYYAGEYSTGNLYACGNPRIDEARTIYRLTFNSSGNLTGVNTGPTITSSGSSSCSPMTEFSNNGTDRIFVSVTAGGNDTGCSGACVYSYDINSSLTSSSSAAAGLAVTGGTSGIVIDNNQSSPTGASQIYFSNLGNATSCGTSGSGGCAVQASQSGLN